MLQRKKNTSKEVFLKTKFVIPTSSSVAINRSSIYKLLDTPIIKRLAIISAPSGFGKTTTLSQWANKTKRKIAWYSIDTGDNKPKKFLIGLVLAIKTLNMRFGEEVLSLLNSSENLNFEYIVTLIINEILELSFEITLIIDDYHLIFEKSVQASIVFLLENLPKNLQIFIATRKSNFDDLPLLKFKMNDSYIEITENMLSFDMGEINSFFSNSDLNLSNNELLLIKERTEGWPLSLQLLKIYFQDFGNKDYFIDNYNGGIDYLFDYLINNIFNKFDDDVKIQLSKISVLSKFNLELLNLVTDNKGLDIIKLIKQNNLFLIVFDKTKNWYRFHNLFSEFLYNILKKSNPNLIFELHEKVSKWFQKNAFLTESYEHIIKTKNIKLIIRFFEELDLSSFKKLSDTHELLDIFNKFDFNIILSSPKFYCNRNLLI